MKKIIIGFILLLTLSSTKSQTFDTVIVRNLTMQAQDWAYLVGSYNVTSDSATMYAYRKIRAKIQEAVPPNWTTNVTVDSLPGRIVVEFYQLVKQSSSGEIVTRYMSITNAIISKTNISYWLGFIDSSMQSEFNRKRDRGKNLLID